MMEKENESRPKVRKLEDIHVQIRRKRIKLKELLAMRHSPDQSVPPTPRTRSERAELALGTFERLVANAVRSNGWNEYSKALETFLLEGNFGAILNTVKEFRAGIKVIESSGEGVFDRMEKDDPRHRVEQEIERLTHSEFLLQERKSKTEWVRWLAKKCGCSEGAIWTWLCKKSAKHLVIPPVLLKPKKITS